MFARSAGRYCEWKHNTVDVSAQTATFAEYMKTVHLDCELGEPAILNWTVPMDAPNTLYYQVFAYLLGRHYIHLKHI